MSPHKWCEQVGVGKEDTEAYIQVGSPEITGHSDASNKVWLSYFAVYLRHFPILPR